MIVKRSGSAIYNRWRPQRFEEFVGNSNIVLAIQKLLEKKEPPQSWLFWGLSGCGKTSMARVIAMKMNCEIADAPCLKCESCLSILQNTSADYTEVNIADKRGIDATRDLINGMRYIPVGKRRVYALDEVHMLTRESANMLLKVFEDGIGTNFIVLCTTDPMSVLPTLKNRAVQFEFKPWNREELESVAKVVFAGEGFTKISEKALVSFVDKTCSNGIISPRAFLNEIEKVIAAKSFDVISTDGGLPADVRSICLALLRADWWSIRNAWNENLEPEQVRIAACAYLRNALLKESDFAQAIAYAEALKELARRVDDVSQQNNLLARLCLCCALLRGEENAAE